MLMDRTRNRTPRERGVVILSIDTEQRWGYLDLLSDAQFERRYPDALGVHDRLLGALQGAGVSATWFVVGGMSLQSSDGAADARMTGLPADWLAGIPAGSETSLPLWYHRSFVEKLRSSSPAQEIGLHGGLTHLLWTGASATRSTVEKELTEGIRALGQVGTSPQSFSFGRELEAHHDLLPLHGIRCYRGRTVSLAHRLGGSIPGKLLRAADELMRAAPPLIWPYEALPGLWNVPSSLFLYPLVPSRSRLVGMRSRVKRFAKGVDAAARFGGIFHYCLHPENLSESSRGCSLFDDMLEYLVLARRMGDIEVLTVGDVALRMEEHKNEATDERSSTSVSRAGVSAASELVCGSDRVRNERNTPE